MADARHEITPEDVAWAKGVAANHARKVPFMADEYESAALLGLVEASLSFDPGRGAKFRTHAARRVVGAIKDVSRSEEVCGYRRSWRASNPGADAPHVDSIYKAVGHRDDGVLVDLTGAIASADLPIGWEAEYQDEVEGLSRRLPVENQASFRAFFGRADAATMKRAGAAAGVSESRVSQIIGNSASYLSERFPDPEDLFMPGHVSVIEAEPGTNGTAARTCPGCDRPITSKRFRCYFCHPSVGPGKARNPGKNGALVASVAALDFAPPPAPAEIPPAAAPTATTATTPRPKADPELAAIGAILSAMDGLGMDAKARVLGYINARVGISV